MKPKSVFLILGLAAFGLTQVIQAQRLPSGTPVIVFLDAAGNLPEPSDDPPRDMLVFTGGRPFSIGLSGCSPETLPLQNAILVDPQGGGRSSRATVVAVKAPGDDPLPPGPRLTGFSPAGSCISDG